MILTKDELKRKVVVNFVCWLLCSPLVLIYCIFLLTYMIFWYAYDIVGISYRSEAGEAMFCLTMFVYSVLFILFFYIRIIFRSYKTFNRIKHNNKRETGLLRLNIICFFEIIFFPFAFFLVCIIWGMFVRNPYGVSFLSIMLCYVLIPYVIGKYLYKKILRIQ